MDDTKAHLMRAMVRVVKAVATYYQLNYGKPSVTQVLYTGFFLAADVFGIGKE